MGVILSEKWDAKDSEVFSTTAALVWGEHTYMTVLDRTRTEHALFSV